MDPYKLLQEDTETYQAYLEFNLDDIKTRSYMEYILNRWNETNAQIYDKYMSGRSDDYRALKYLRGKSYREKINRVTIHWYNNKELARICKLQREIIDKAIREDRYDAMDLLPSSYFKFSYCNNETIIDLYIIRRQRLAFTRDIVERFPFEVYKVNKELLKNLKLMPGTNTIYQLFQIKNYDQEFNILDHVIQNESYYTHDEEEGLVMLGLRKGIIRAHNKIRIIEYIPDYSLDGNILNDIDYQPKLASWIRKYTDQSILTASLMNTKYMQYMRPDAQYEKIKIIYNKNLAKVANEHKLNNITVIVDDLRSISDYDYIAFIRAGITVIEPKESNSFRYYNDVASIMRYMEYYSTISLSPYSLSIPHNSIIEYKIGLRNYLNRSELPPHSIVNYAFKHYPDLVPDRIYDKYSKYIKRRKRIIIESYWDVEIVTDN